ncbi:MAG TPA: serine hydrolase [Streptosporangiaceae bacterium]|nr:serine hydrolase [Streptosporangiaceae bacterium]
MASYVAGTHYYITAAVYDRKTGQTFVLDPKPGAVERTASIVKVEIMGDLFREHEADKQPLSDSDISLLTTMIENSDNDSATSLWNEDGGAPSIQTFDDSIGMTGTTASADPWIPGSTDLPGWGWTSTTARDQVRLVRDFAYKNKWISDSYREQGLHLMESIESDQDWGVSSGVPSGVTVALKNGWLPIDLTNDTDWQINSIGWVKGDGRDYVLAILCQGSLSEGDGIAAVDHIAAQVYSALG